MPPRKLVRSLQDLTFAAYSQLVLNSCQRIEEDVASEADFDLPFDSEDYKNAVASLRQHLRKSVAPVLWETLFNYVLHLYKKNTTLDPITLFSLFVFEEANFNTVTLPSNMTTECPRRVKFWVECAAMLANLIEVDLRNVGCDQIVAAFCRSCTKLEVITIPVGAAVPEMLVLLLVNSKNLRRIIIHPITDEWEIDTRKENSLIRRVFRELPHLEYFNHRFPPAILKTLNTNRLKLRHLMAYLKSSYDIKAVAELFPDLEELSVYGGFAVSSTLCTNTFKALTSSSLQISILSLTFVNIDLDVFDEFLSTKGIYITELTIDNCTLIGAPRLLLEILSKCPNLTKFVVLYLLGLRAEHLATSHLVDEIFFPNLEHLSIKTSRTLPDMYLATKIVERSMKMSRLTLGSTDRDGEDIGELWSNCLHVRW